jgi:hypothetical protein
VIGIAFAFLVTLAVVQRPNAAPEDPTGVIKLLVRLKVGDSLKSAPRKRFFLIKGTLAQNTATIASIQQRPLTSRECYYRSIGASEGLIDWLREGDCESVFCRTIDQKFTEGAAAVREFAQAVTDGASKKEFFFDREIARNWLVVNLPPKIRNGFYDEQQSYVRASVTQAQQTSQAAVMSVMTDSKGSAYFTDVPAPPKKENDNTKYAYVISNIVPAEIGGRSVIWNCQIELSADDIGSEKLYTIPNTKTILENGKKVPACVVVDVPTPTCKP